MKVVLLLLMTALMAAAYDPLALPTGPLPAPLDLSCRDEARSREIPLRVYLPAVAKPAAVVLFSHGLGGSREGSAFLGRHWAARGYVAVFLQHPGSDESIWKDLPPARRALAMQAAASPANFLSRVQDVPAVLDQLEVWQRLAEHPLAGRLDLRRVGMSGHSFGAVTTQAVCGQVVPMGGARFSDPRLKAAVIFSPSTPARADPAAAFGRVRLPWLLMTGTNDVARIGGATIGAADVASRLSVYPALPPGGKYELVLHEASHFAFTDRPDFGGETPRHPNHHRVILAISTAFWDAWLKDDAAARAWLEGEPPRALMAAEDRWQHK
jgi:predicted dienelactone hydrolase